MQARRARLQLQSQRVAPSLLAAFCRAVILGADNLDALNNRKVVARLWLSSRRIVLHRGLPLFHHQKLPKIASRLYLIMTERDILGRAAARCPCRSASPDLSRPRGLPL